VVNEKVIALRTDERAGVIAAHLVKNRRLRPAHKLLTTPLEGVELNSPTWIRALSAWVGWLAWVLMK
jgi:hypothetical protein